MSNIDIDFYCRVYDDFLEPQFCDQYIEKFEETITKDIKRHRELSACYREDGSMFCSNCDCMRTNPMEYERFSDLNSYLIPQWQRAVDRYKEDVKIHQNQWPEKYGWEELRIKRFRVDSTKFHGLKLHTDVYSYAHAKRFLAMMVYLTDDFEDGETHFPLFEAKIKPKRGRLLIFPPSWNYLHQGIPPNPPSRSGAKYFIMTHLVYVDEGDHVNYGIDFSDRTEAARDQVSTKIDKENRGLQMWPKNH